MLFTDQDAPAQIRKTLLHELHRGALDSKHPFRYINLATIGENGPEVRTVVCRYVSQDLEFFMYTDSRSEKVSELQLNSLASLHFYHAAKRVQIRIKAKTEIHHQDQVSKGFWSKVQGEAQKAYTSTLAPSILISNPNEAFDWMENADDRYFAVLKFIPESIEALQLNGLQHLRILFSEKDNWAGQWLVP
jgi:pyridoxine/pyridoxamine 5'-phosphate oxidase